MKTFIKCSGLILAAFMVIMLFSGTAAANLAIDFTDPVWSGATGNKNFIVGDIKAVAER